MRAPKVFNNGSRSIKKSDAGTCDNDVVDSNVTNVVGGRNVTNDDVDGNIDCKNAK